MIVVVEDGDPDEQVVDEEVTEAPPEWLTLEELAEKIFLDQMSHSTARALIEILAERRASPDAAVVALLAVILQVQEQVDDPSKDLISFVLSAMEPVASLFVETAGTYPITEHLWLRRWVNSENRFMVLAPRSWLEPMGEEINERLNRLAGGEGESP